MSNKQLRPQAGVFILNSFTRQNKEVDLRVAQELKNNQDFIYQTNQALQRIERQVTSYCNDQSKLRANFEEADLKLKIELENLKNDYLEVSSNTTQELGDFASCMIDLTNEITEKFKQVYEELSTITDLTERCKRLEDSFFNLDKRMEAEKSFVCSSLVLLKGQMDQQIAFLKQELTPKIPEIDPIQKALNERLQPIDINFKGLQKEIEILKKAVSYSEKKFENIYTLIDRLKVEL